jgi:hypothetical protein
MYRLIIALALFAVTDALLTPRLAPPPDPLSLALSGAAKLVLESRLQEVQSVEVHVRASPLSIMGGGVDGVRVIGRGWCTPMRLSCRILDVSVGRTVIDVEALVRSRRILLRRAAMGDATMVFNGIDWQNFLEHPLMVAAIADRRLAAPCPKISFAGASRRAAVVRDDGVEFALRWGESSLVARLHQRLGDRVMASVRAVDHDAIKPSAALADVDADNARRAASWIVDFFEGLVLDLDGCELRFRSLGAATDRLELRLDVRVRSFPSLDVNF